MPASYEERILYHACEVSISYGIAVYHIVQEIYHYLCYNQPGDMMCENEEELLRLQNGDEKQRN